MTVTKTSLQTRTRALEDHSQDSGVRLRVAAVTGGMTGLTRAGHKSLQQRGAIKPDHITDYPAIFSAPSQANLPNLLKRNPGHPGGPW